MARIKNNFKMTREQMELLVEALTNAECWKMELANNHPEFSDTYGQQMMKYVELEFTIREMLGNKPII